jgi:hypothetical protein
VTDDITNELLPAWTAALPHVLKLLPDLQRRMFRGELQRFLAVRRMQPIEAEGMVEPLRDLLLQSARTAQIPAAIHATRTHVRDAATLERLIGHILASWRDAEAASSSCAPRIDESGRTGKVFFGPRLGGPGRPGAVKSGTESPPEE